MWHLISLVELVIYWPLINGHNIIISEKLWLWVILNRNNLNKVTRFQVFQSNTNNSYLILIILKWISSTHTNDPVSVRVDLEVMLINCLILLSSEFLNKRFSTKCSLVPHPKYSLIFLFSTKYHQLCNFHFLKLLPCLHFSFSLNSAATNTYFSTVSEKFLLFYSLLIHINKKNIGSESVNKDTIYQIKKYLQFKQKIQAVIYSWK